MKKNRILGVAMISLGLLTGCSVGSPDRTAISVEKDYAVVSYIKESFDKAYYNSGELEATIDQAIYEYNEKAGAEIIEKTEFEVKNQIAEVEIKYATGDAYSKFNDITLFSGDVVGAYHAGYDFAGPFQSIEKGKVTRVDVTGNEILNSYNYGILILEENVDVYVPGNIVYASSNVQITGRRTATVLASGSQGKTEKVEHETNANGEVSIAPVSSGSVNTATGESGKLAYILYD